RHHPRLGPLPPTVFAPRRDAPVVELLHPVARDPQARSLPRRIIRQVGATCLQVADQILQDLDVPHLTRPRTKQFQRLLDPPPTQPPGTHRLALPPAPAAAPAPVQLLPETLHPGPPADDHRRPSEAHPPDPAAAPPPPAGKARQPPLAAMDLQHRQKRPDLV